MEFIRHKGFTEKYDWTELEKLADSIDDDHIFDNDLYVNKKVIEKR